MYFSPSSLFFSRPSSFFNFEQSIIYCNEAKPLKMRKLEQEKETNTSPITIALQGTQSVAINTQQ